MHSHGERSSEGATNLAQSGAGASGRARQQQQIEVARARRRGRAAVPCAVVRASGRGARREGN
jgi:hypothetical protein